MGCSPKDVILKCGRKVLVKDLESLIEVIVEY